MIKNAPTSAAEKGQPKKIETTEYSAGGSVDVIYPYKRSKSNDRELRYSLRSLSNFKNLRKVIISGEIPEWTTNVTYIPCSLGDSKTSSARANYVRALSHPDTANTCLLMNDDFFIMKPMDEMPLYHGVPLEEFLAKYRGTFPKSYYTQKIQDTTRIIPSHMFSYELHIPFQVDKNKALQIMTDPGLQKVMFRTVYGNMFHHQDPGTFRRDVKYYRRTVDKWFMAPEIDFISSDDSVFAGDLEEYLKTKFKEKSPYERI